MATSSLVGYSQTFRDFFRDHQENGVNCAGNPSKYIPYSFLLDYWKKEEIRRILVAANIRVPSITSVRNHYLRVFSILVSRSMLHLLEAVLSSQLKDSTLPWLQAPDIFQNTDRDFQIFFSSQWAFCPMLLNPDDVPCDTKLHEWTILPFTKIDSARKGPAREASSEVMIVHEAAHKHLEKRHEIPRRVFLKTYDQKYLTEYNNEKVANGAFRCNNIVRCQGSFHWHKGKEYGRTSTLIFDYAEHGNLLDLYNQSHIPYLPVDIRAFWYGMLGVTKGLQTIHKQAGCKSFHHDMKPSNIVVFKKELKGNKHSYEFKIADLGASYVVPIDGSDACLETIDRGTTRTYGPPETYLGDDVTYIVGPKFDMWSIGCILFDAAVWVTFGEAGRQDFTDRRIDETSKLPDHKRLGRSDCFHDGSIALKCVREYAQLIRYHGRPRDDITTSIVELVTKNLLVEEDSRIDSLNLYTRLNGILNGIKTTVASPAVPHPPYTEPGPSYISTLVSSPILPGELPRNERDVMYREDDENESTGSIATSPLSAKKENEKENENEEEKEKEKEIENGTTEHKKAVILTIEQLEDWIAQGKNKGKRSRDSELPGWETAQWELGGRDFILLIDNSKSMQRNKEEVVRYVSALSYLVKKLDPDGCEILCTSNRNVCLKFKTSTAAKDFVTANFRDGRKSPCNMEAALADVVEKIRTQALGSSSRFSFKGVRRPGNTRQQTSVLVFTDGVWDASNRDGLADVDLPLKQLIGHMKDRGIHRSDIAIQFLRFGSDPIGKKRLKFLDDDLDRKFDIVDQKPLTADIWDILTGSVRKGADKD